MIRGCSERRDVALGVNTQRQHLSDSFFPCCAKKEEVFTFSKKAALGNNVHLTLKGTGQTDCTVVGKRFPDTLYICNVYCANNLSLNLEFPNCLQRLTSASGKDQDDLGQGCLNYCRQAKCGPPNDFVSKKHIHCGPTRYSIKHAAFAIILLTSRWQNFSAASEMYQLYFGPLPGQFTLFLLL